MMNPFNGLIGRPSITEERISEVEEDMLIGII